MPDYTSTPIAIQLTKGKIAFVDAIDSDLANQRWHSQEARNNDVRAVHWNKERKLIYLHRVIVERIIGRPLLSSEIVDHIDGNGLNNTRDNLRVATHAENMHNRKKNTNNKSGYKGVRETAVSGHWSAVIRVNGKRIHLGIFNSPEAAYEAYCAGAMKHFGRFARFK